MNIRPVDRILKLLDLLELNASAAGEPGFAVTVNTDHWDVPAEGTLGIPLSVTRSGYNGPIEVSVAGHVESSTKERQEAEGQRAALPFYRWRIASAAGGSRMWLRGEESIDCVDNRGTVLATISATPSERAVIVSRDFSQVLVVTEKGLDPVSVERYEVPQPCRP